MLSVISWRLENYFFEYILCFSVLFLFGCIPSSVFWLCSLFSPGFMYRSQLGLFSANRAGKILSECQAIFCLCYMTSSKKPLWNIFICIILFKRSISCVMIIIRSVSRTSHPMLHCFSHIKGFSERMLWLALVSLSFLPACLSHSFRTLSEVSSLLMNHLRTNLSLLLF